MTAAPIRIGMVGGGIGANIGAVHRIAARLDGQYVLVAGAFSSSAENCRSTAAALGIAPERAYANFADMAAREKQREDAIEAVVIVTPNHLHMAACRPFLEAGIHVICDKPLTARLEEAEELAGIARASGCQFLLTHVYSGYPMTRQARRMVAEGAIGTVRLVQMEYAQDWLATPLDNKQATWRADPRLAGAGAIADIGTHALHLGMFMSGLEPVRLLADLQSFVWGRQVDDNAHILLQFDNGARGMLWASQVASGCENALTIRIYGDKGGLEFSQEEPNRLWYTALGGVRQMITRGGAGSSPETRAEIRVPAGHPEGFLEAFATLYRDFAGVLRGGAVPDDKVLPGIEAGLMGMRFIDAALKSHAEGGRWVDLKAKV